MTARMGDDVTIRIIGQDSISPAAEQADTALRALEAAGERAGKRLAEKSLRLGTETAFDARQAAELWEELIVAGQALAERMAEVEAETVERD
jgi:hypothetical protein